jgi:Transposase DDE domain
MKDGRTHLAHKAEQAVDLETGAVVGVTVQDANEGDTTTSRETLIEAAEQIETVLPEGDGLQEVVGDKGYHSNDSLVDLEAVGVRTYISEPDRGRRNWTKHPEARDAVYRNRRRIRGARGQRLLRTSGTPLRASLRDRRHAPPVPSRAHEHSKAPVDPHRRLQSRTPHAPSNRRRHATRVAGPCARGFWRRSHANSGPLGSHHVPSSINTTPVHAGAYSDHPI